MPLLLNELAAEPRPAILVLDDYQAVTNPDCHELLALFIERLPATLHLVVATRIHPPIPWPGCGPAASWPSWAPPISA